MFTGEVKLQTAIGNLAVVPNGMILTATGIMVEVGVATAFVPIAGRITMYTSAIITKR